MGDLRQLVRLHVGTQGDPFRGDGGTHSPDVAVKDVAVDQHVGRIDLVRNARHGAPSLGERCQPALRINRSTYFATTSTSRFTRVPTAADPSVVSSRVVGISETSNQSRCSAPSPETVREIPST